jgi:hypothetical protein
MIDAASLTDGDLAEAAREIARLGLEREVYELEVFGLTVVPADRTGAAALCQRAFERACELLEERTGTYPDVETGSTHVDVCTPSLYHFLHEDGVFQDLVTHEMALALSAMLVGRRSIVAGTELFMKGPATRDTGNDIGLAPTGDGLQLGLHSDNVTVPEPFPMLAHGCNVTWLFSDYTREGGALAFVPGSHRLCRQPLGGEAVKRALPVEAPLGSLVVWHGNTWHGSFPRKIPGLRTGMATGVYREYMHPHEPVRRDVSDEAVRARGDRFAALAGRDIIDWGTEGPDYPKLVKRPFRYTPYT